MKTNFQERINQGQERVSKAEEEIETHLSSPPQRSAPKGEERWAVMVVEMRQKLKAVRDGTAMAPAVRVKDAVLIVFNSHRSGRKASTPL